MEKVTGIGGVFLRAKAPDTLAAWYRDVLGVPLAPGAQGGMPWVSEAGVTIFAPFAEASDYYPQTQQVMLNFRVTDLAAMLAQVRAAGAEVFNEQSMDGVGHFAHIRDPEDNVIELWQPTASPMPT